MALINEVVHTTGNESVGGVKTFTSAPVFPAASYASEQEVMDHADTIKIVDAAVLKKHTLITKLNIISNFV